MKDFTCWPDDFILRILRRKVGVYFFVVAGFLFSFGQVANAEDERCPCAAGEVESSTSAAVKAAGPAKSGENLESGSSVGAVTQGDKKNLGPRGEGGSLSKGASVLVLGDSLALCGFGKTLDARLRKCADVTAVYSYMACGTVPISWLKTGIFAKAHTGCGLWTILGKKGERPAEFQDTYGMEKGRHPGVHPVPKLELLLEEHHPDILVVQNGTNLLSLFSDGKTLLPVRHETQLRSYVEPFVAYLAEHAPTVKKVYWVAPPVSGRVTPEIQDFLFKHLEAYASPFFQTIDSRGLLKHPYRGTMVDKEHFIGRDMELWAESIYEQIAKDLAGGVLKGGALSRERLLVSKKRADVEKANSSKASRKNLVVRAKLIAKSTPIETERLLPYQESLVSYLYQVKELISGEYHETELAVMHPAHIRLNTQALSKYKIGRTYLLDLVDFEGSPWEAIKRSEETGRIELSPYIRREDEARFPTAGNPEQNP
jgi:hypothetical protein